MTVEAADTETHDGVPARLRDGYEVHRAGLRHGMDVLLLPRQVLTLRRDGGDELGFVHGVPQPSTLAAVTYAQDKRMRRELLAAAGVPVPPGASFAIGREVERARRFAAEIGYPVVVKPAVGDNMSEVAAGLADDDALDRAIEYLRTPELERPLFGRSAYALTLLLEADEEDGRAVAPAGYQFFLEKHVSGECLRLVVHEGSVVSAVLWPGGGAPPADVTGQMHESVAALATRAVAALPGLTVAAVDLVLDDHRRPVDAQQVAVVEFSERPWLAAQAGLDDTLSRGVGEALLRRYAEQAGVALGPAADNVSVSFEVEGATSPPDVATAMRSTLGEYRLSGEVEVADQVGGTVHGTLDGQPDGVAAMFEHLLDGRLRNQRAMLVAAEHRSRTDE